MLLIEPCNLWNTEKSLRVPKEVIVVQLVSLLARSLDLFCQEDRLTPLPLLDLLEYLSVGKWCSLNLGKEPLCVVHRVTATSSFHRATHRTGRRHAQIVHAQANGPTMRKNDLSGEAMEVAHDDLSARLCLS